MKHLKVILIAIALNACGQNLDINKLYNLEVVSSISPQEWTNTSYKVRVNTAMLYLYQNSSGEIKDRYIKGGFDELIKDADSLEKCVSDGIEEGRFATSGAGFGSCNKL